MYNSGLFLPHTAPWNYVRPNSWMNNRFSFITIFNNTRKFINITSYSPLLVQTRNDDNANINAWGAFTNQRQWNSTMLLCLLWTLLADEWLVDMWDYTWKRNQDTVRAWYILFPRTNMYENTRKHKFNVSINTNELSHQIKLKIIWKHYRFPNIY